MEETSAHSASDAALGFRYQGLHALLMLWREVDDDAAIYIETLDDVVLTASGATFLEQLKHTLVEKPSPLTLKSVSLWKTLRAWIDVLPEIDMARTRFNLVSVANIQAGSLLEALLDEDSDRSDLIIALNEEAERVQRERADAKSSGKPTLPHAERVAGCEAFLGLGADIKSKLISAARLKPGQPNVTTIEEELANDLKSVPAEKRPQVAKRLVEWWDRQVLYSMCNKREKAISRFEVVQRHSEIVADIELDRLPNPFETVNPPASYRPDSMIEKQISLVDGSSSELSRAIREEWRARETRSAWSTENPSRHDLILRYDERLTEEWADRHTEICEQCDGASDDEAKAKGHALLKWSHFDAPNDIESIAATVTAPYYVRGSFQVLSTTGRVGWHPDFRTLLGFES
ncbi:MAG: hypothetical protein NXI16_11450 [Alphaproteobacteria bacterium]|nr:hypothetical protein [Alphaproteobacteria bacterium]